MKAAPNFQSPRRGWGAASLPLPRGASLCAAACSPLLHLAWSPMMSGSGRCAASGACQTLGRLRA